MIKKTKFMKYFNFLFAVECVRNLETGEDCFFLRTNDGRVLSYSPSGDFTKEMIDFINEITKKVS